MYWKQWKRMWLFWLLVFGLLCTACSAKSVGSETSYDTSGNGEESADASMSDEASKNGDGSKAADASNGAAAGLVPAEGEFVIPSQLSVVCGSYFKAGDFKYRLVIAPGRPEQPNTVSIRVETRDLVTDYRNWSNIMVTLQELTASYEVTGNTVRLKDESPLKFNLDGSITLADGTEAAGDYYSFTENLIMPEFFLRPLNDTDLIGMTPEEMRLVRNECYAVYGRTFVSEDLQTYFESKPWYRAVSQPDSFSDDILGDMVKRNVEFLKEAEAAYNPDSAKELEAAYNRLPESPYLYHLPARGEVFVSIESAAGTAEDCGIYYSARGVIGIPLTFTVSQKREMEAGNAVEIDVSGLIDTGSEWPAGSKAWIKKAEHPDYGEYVILRSLDEKEEDSFYAEATYNADMGVYKLWQNSVDTIFRNVYEGDIYVLKGASEEYYRHFDRLDGNKNESAGTFRIMDFNETDGTPYEGNEIVTDGKGYIKALYFYGD